MRDDMLESFLLDVESLNRRQNYYFNGLSLTGDFDIDIPVVARAVERTLTRLNTLSKSDCTTTELAANYLVVANWRKEKVIYTFDADLSAALMQTETTELSSELIARLPHKSFFINYDSPNTPLLGAFISICKHDDGAVQVGVIELTGYISEQHDVCLTNNIFLLYPNTDIRKLVTSMFANPNYDSEEVAKRFVFVLTCMYYLAAQNADIVYEKTSKKARPTRANGSKLNLKRWNVGYRIGAEYRARKLRGSNDTSSGTHNSPRPHVRKAHWHHYWCGEGRDHLEVRWLCSTFVNADSSDDLVATSHRVRGSK